MDYVLHRARLYCQIEGLRVKLPRALGGGKAEIPFALPVVGASWTYELNSIPTASCVIAVGREFRSGSPSPIHALAEYLTRRRRAKILLKLTRVDAGRRIKTFGIPDDAVFTVFDGFTSLGGFSRTAASAGYQLQLEHWLGELAYSSTFSKSSHPANPSQYSFGAMLTADEAGFQSWTNLTQSDKYIDINSLQNDLWMDGFRAWLLALCSRDLFEAWEPAHIAPGGANDPSAAALGRMGKSKASVPLKLNLAVDNEIVSALRDDVAMATQDPGEMAHMTLWDLLVGRLAPEYLFAVVPRVDDALVVPYTPACRSAYKTIMVDETTSFEWNKASQRPIRAVGVQSHLGLDAFTNLDPVNAAAASAIGIGGIYPTDASATPQDGMIYILAGPRWVGELVDSAGHANEAAGLAGAPNNHAIQPAANPGNGAAAAGRARAKGVVKPFLDRYAQYRYAQEATRGRQGVVSGPLRMDVAPGSSVKVVVPGDGPDDKLGLPFYGTVVRVSGFINAEGQQAGTGFHLAYIRTEAEQSGAGADNVSVKAHPLYVDTFEGCGLTDDP